MSRYLLIHHSRDGGEVRFELEPGETYRLGAKADNDLVIPDSDVSRHHAILRAGDGTFHLTDLNSKNGTFVNGARVTDATIRCGDLIGLSSAKLVVVEVSSGAYAMVPDPLPDEDRRTDPSQDTSEHTAAVAPEELIELFEEVAGAIPRGGLAAPLAWAVRNLAVDAALLLYTDGDGAVSLLTSAGDLGPWAAEGAAMARVVRDHPPHTHGRTSVRHVNALGDELLVSSVTANHVLVFRCGASQPTVADLRAVVVATSLALGAQGSGPRDRAAFGVVAGGAVAGYEDGVLIGPSPAVAAMRSRIVELAATGRPVAVVGETGVGRRAVAHELHRAGRGAPAPVVELVCDTAVAALLAAAPTCGDDMRGSPWATARGGSLVLLGGERLPVEAWRPVLERASRPDVDVRVITTWRIDENGAEPLPPAARRLRVPPLRERRDDVPPLVARWATVAGPSAWSAACLETLAAYAWPDNLRELHGEVRRIQAVHPHGRAVEVGDLAPRIRGQAAAGALEAQQLLGMPLVDARRRFERWFVSRALRDNHGNQTRTAEQLGVSRAGLFRMLRRLGLGDDPHAD